MQVDRNKVREKLQSFKFTELLREELGWDKPGPSIPPVTQNGIEFTLLPVAQKRGVQVFLCTGSTGELPDYPIRKIIESKVRKYAHEHLIIFVDGKKSVQRWQWVKREPNKPLQVREYAYDGNKAGELLVQRLEELAVSLDEEEKITLVDVTGKMRQAFDRDKVTKRFYDEFKKQRDNFAKFLKGIPTGDMEPWYVSVMLNRLMFIYFIQKKGFLNSDQNYLKVKLSESQSKGKDRYYTNFLCPLFFEGFAKKGEERSTEHKKLLGDIPYLNGGLFLKHQIEELHGHTIEICDKAFEHIFEFFDRFNWHLDERPLKNDKEINPEVLGFIFEKYINQKQMGAYYTKEDITGYITKNTVIPYLFDAARKECKIAFEGTHAVWHHLKDDPDRYIYLAVKRGIDLLLPEDIEAGITDVSKRTGWNKPAPSDYALPTEIWREIVARRQRYQEVRSKIAAGEITSINDLITYNLDIRQFAQDVIENCEGPELLRAFWKAISKITVLDPTCGSGAFLFAALNILEPLYEACLDRMQNFVDDMERSGQKHSPEKFKDFKQTLEKVNNHPNRKYFIYKSIIINNLFGVDIMEEAVEICKLRLFLKLVAQVDDKHKIEPLPDIDFNIRPGNTLIGFANYEDAQRHITSKLDFENTMVRIDEQAQDLARLFQRFREQQTELGGEVSPEDKENLRQRLESLQVELNSYLAVEYGVDPKKAKVYEKWLKTHLPFHWYTEFYEIIHDGGFNIVVGNPPYVEYSGIRSEYRVLGYKTESCGNLYAYVFERSLSLAHSNARTGLIVPISFVCTQRMEPLLREVLQKTRLSWNSCYAERPSKLFTGAEVLLTIAIAAAGDDDCQVHCTNLRKWPSSFREHLFDTTEYVPTEIRLRDYLIPKLGASIERRILEKVYENAPARLSHITTASKRGSKIFYRIGGGRYWKIFTTFQPKFVLNGTRGVSSRENYLYFEDEGRRDCAVIALSSSLFFWYFVITTNGRDLNPFDLYEFPIQFVDQDTGKYNEFCKELMEDYRANKRLMHKTSTKTGDITYEEFYPRKSKHIIDKIDTLLGSYLGLSVEELDFIINYDIKYRMGQESDEGEE